MAIWDAVRMSLQISVRLDDPLAKTVDAAAAAAGTDRSTWVRSAIRRQALLDTARRARVEEDAGTPLHTAEREDALMAARRRRAAAAFDDPAFGQR
jgi:metal-responsive CopG/Arc/MetJ family transcriptional regulator